MRSELARNVSIFVGSAESKITDIPGLSLHRYTAPTAPACGTYEPSVALVVQGRKQVELGRSTFLYDGSRFLLTSLDLPVVSRVVDASQERPYLCLRLKLDMTTAREILSREDFEMTPAQSDAPAMTTAETSAEFLGAFCRLMDLVATPQDIPFLSPLIQREVI